MCKLFTIKESIVPPKWVWSSLDRSLHRCGDHRTHACISGDYLAKNAAELSELQCGGATGATRGVSRRAGRRAELQPDDAYPSQNNPHGRSKDLATVSINPKQEILTIFNHVGFQQFFYRLAIVCAVDES
jgi:hypothetical protein